MAQIPSQDSSANGRSNEWPVTASETDSHSEASPATLHTDSPNITETLQPSVNIFPQINSQQNPTLENSINLEHMELLLHCIKTEDLFSLGGDRRVNDAYFTASDIIELGIGFPALLHQLLAFSARHLASIHPSKAEHYLHQAITLQTRAVSLFNSSYAPITQETCVPILLFATTLGHHVFTDTLCRRDTANLDTFLVHFVQCLVTLKGVYVVFQEARPFWEKSVLADILSRSSSLTSRASVGSRCQRAKELVEASFNLNPEEKHACKEAIRGVEVGFDALHAEHEEPENQYQMLFLWCILVSREFIALVASKKMEALVIVGYYATLLQYGTEMWQVEDAGEYILGLLRAYFDERMDWDWDWTY